MANEKVTSSKNSILSPQSSRNNKLNQVIGYIENIRSSAAAKTVKEVDDFNNVIGISGLRGYGKTTLVKQVTKELKNGMDIVFNIIYPYEYKDYDSLYGLILAQLDYEFDIIQDNISDDHPKYTEFIETRKKINKLQLYHARSSSLFAKNLMNTGDRGDDFSWQLVESNKRKIKNKMIFPSLINEVLDIREDILFKRSKHSSLLIIPLDDCDLSPESINILIDDLNIFKNLPRVVFIIPYSPNALVRAMSSKVLNSFGNVPSQMREFNLIESNEIQQEVGNLINKVFPSFHSIDLNEWDKYKSRLFYSPLNSDSRSLLDLFESISFSEEAPFKKLSELFVFDPLLSIPDESNRHKNNCYFPYSSILPKSGRGLFNLYESLRFIVDSQESSKEYCSSELKTILEIISNNSLNENTLLVKKKFHSIVSWTNEDILSYDFSELQTGKLSLFTTLQDRILLDDIGTPDFFIDKELYLDYFNELNQEKIDYLDFRIKHKPQYYVYLEKQNGEETNNEKLETILSTLILFFSEFQHKSFKIDYNVYGDYATPGHASWNHLIYIKDSNGKEISHKPLIVPSYDNYLPYLQYSLIWDYYTNIIENYEIDFSILRDSKDFCDFVACLHLNMILTTESQISVYTIENEIGKDIHTFLQKQIIELKNNIKDNLNNLIAGNLNCHIEDDLDDFLYNFTHCLIHCAQTLFFSKELVDWVRDALILPIVPNLTKSISVKQRAKLTPCQRPILPPLKLKKISIPAL